MAMFFAASAGAGGVYNGFASGNPDLFEDQVAQEDVTAVQPAIGADFDIYSGFSGNPDLFTSPEGGGTGGHSGHPDIYGGFESGNPDLR
jgi:hypothetical protein